MTISRYNSTLLSFDPTKNYGLGAGKNVEQELAAYLLAQGVAFAKNAWRPTKNASKETSSLDEKSCEKTKAVAAKQVSFTSTGLSCAEQLLLGASASALIGNPMPMVVPALGCTSNPVKAEQGKTSRGMIPWLQRIWEGKVIGKPSIEDYGAGTSMAVLLSSETGDAKLYGGHLVRSVQNPALAAFSEAYLLLSKAIYLVFYRDPLVYRNPSIGDSLIETKNRMSETIYQIQVSGANGVMILSDKEKDVARIIRKIERMEDTYANPDSPEALSKLGQYRDEMNLIWKSALTLILDGPMRDLSDSIDRVEVEVRYAAQKSHSTREKLSDYQKQLKDLNDALASLEAKEKKLESQNEKFRQLKSEELAKRVKDRKSVSVLWWTVASWDEVHIPDLGSESANREANEIKIECSRLKSRISGIESEVDRIKTQLSDYSIKDSVSAEDILEMVGKLIGYASDRVRKTKVALASFSNALSTSSHYNPTAGGLSSDHDRADIYAELSNRHNVFAGLYYFFGLQEYSGRSLDSVLKSRVAKIDSSQNSREEKYKQIDNIDFSAQHLEAIAGQGDRHFLLDGTKKNNPDL